MSVASIAQSLARATERLAAAGSASARLDAEVLLAHVLGVDRSALIAHPDVALSLGQAERFEAMLVRRSRGEPVAYIREVKEFYALAMAVDGRVLIPRPETETLVDLALEHVRAVLTAAPRPEETAPFLVWDIGTGSGAIGVAMARELRRRRYEDVRFVLSDISAEALAVARLNAVSHAVADLMTFALGDLGDVVPPPGRPVDLIVANLPYIPSRAIGDLPVAASFEPREALDGGEDGLALVSALLAQLPAILAPEGRALLEIGSDQAQAVRDAATRAVPERSLAMHPDLGGRPRVASLGPVAGAMAGGRDG